MVMIYTGTAVHNGNFKNFAAYIWHQSMYARRHTIQSHATQCIQWQVPKHANCDKTYRNKRCKSDRNSSTNVHTPW